LDSRTTGKEHDRIKKEVKIAPRWDSSCREGTGKKKKDKSKVISEENEDPNILRGARGFAVRQIESRKKNRGRNLARELKRGEGLGFQGPIRP